MLTRGEGGVQEPLILADVICEQPLICYVDCWMHTGCLGDSYFDDILNFISCLLPSCSHLVIDFRTVFVLVINGQIWPKWPFMAIGPHVTNMGSPKMQN